MYNTAFKYNILKHNLNTNGHDHNICLVNHAVYELGDIYYISAINTFDKYYLG